MLWLNQLYGLWNHWKLPLRFSVLDVEFLPCPPLLSTISIQTSQTKKNTIFFFVSGQVDEIRVLFRARVSSSFYFNFKIGYCLWIWGEKAQFFRKLQRIIRGSEENGLEREREQREDKRRGVMVGWWEWGWVDCSVYRCSRSICSDKSVIYLLLNYTWQNMIG